MSSVSAPYLPLINAPHSVGSAMLTFVLLLACRPEVEQDQTTETVQPEIECGLHAHAEDRFCVCDTSHDWCPSFPGQCCHVGTQFDVYLVDAVVLPHKEEGGGDPWDWDGTVPGWLLEAIRTLAPLVDEFLISATGLPIGEMAVGVLELTNEFAPRLLEGSVPPDPYVWVTDAGGDEVFWTRTASNTITPVWNQGFQYTRSLGDPLWYEVWDEDVAFDDQVGEVALWLEELQLLAGLGPVSIAGDSQLGSITVEVWPR